MKVFKFIPPYTADGKTKFPERGKTGVYLIKENGKIVYIGYSLNDLYKTMYRHFQTWNHTGQEVVSYNAKGSDTYTVRVVYCTPSQADRLERYLIRKHKPRDNKYIYELNFRDKNTGEQYENSDPQTPKFTAAELKVQEEDKAYFEELEKGGAAMFGISSKKNISIELNKEELEVTIIVLSKIITSMKKDYITKNYTDEGNITLFLTEEQLLNLYSTAQKLTGEYKK